MENIYLSERNLRTLLSKIERKKAGEPTACTLIKHAVPGDPFVQSMNAVIVTAVPDEEYYTNRDAGEVHPLDTPV